mmetsp:Transcript_10662/g.17919  ORF Transcript_10662/g.17919 Transcript_10662/m.17919 type:complete len:310 (-) Transcript_10662:395-1324(-)
MVELIIVLPQAYPSHQRPLILQASNFYAEVFKIEDYIVQQLNEKWTEEMPVLYDLATFIQDDLIEGYHQEGLFGEVERGPGSVDLVRFQFDSMQITQMYVNQAQSAYRRQFDEEQHNCGVCTRDQLGQKFYFMSGCAHFFCRECVHDMVVAKIEEGNISQLTCPEASCRRPFNDMDIKNLGLGEALFKKYEKLSLDNAIAKMDDMGWCPLPSCAQISDVDKSANQGKCTFCDFVYCLDCKERVHPFKRCLINRLDLKEEFLQRQDIREISEQNQRSEEILNKLFMKHCTKSCPNPKCGVPITKVESGCT